MKKLQSRKIINPRGRGKKLLASMLSRVSPKQSQQMKAWDKDWDKNWDKDHSERWDVKTDDGGNTDWERTWKPN